MFTAIFGDAIILRSSEWILRECYFLALNYSSLWDSIHASKDNIGGTVDEIRPILRSKVLENWMHIDRAYKRSRRGHLNGVVFRT